jgi:DNA replication protein DnaC
MVELLILDDIGYIKQSADEAEVLFTLIAQGYERHVCNAVKLSHATL